ncbi:inositol monophosphatase [Alphaproteobacteria bacterium GH1-50]|uniref:Inositol monophosphatase n=1 Tax=Kangsaoukella pontilimi TaxID=2691042 RepID=A0A7C9MW69_9RHOB|nr:inositol monophosphatase [Kangsaoukella pontilimi]MXQ07394.1 inositol monophosphatase [Kangsaoukella pontilimi]
MIPNPRQIEELIELVRDTARTEIMPRFRNLHSAEISTKAGPTDLVTVADRAAEDAIRRGVLGILPGATVIGEEAVAEAPGLLSGMADAETCVIIDPIDGTGNYVAGLAVFGTILAVLDKGETVFGLLYDPVMDDWMYALRGKGAWFHRQDGSEHPVRARSEVCQLSAAKGFVTVEDYDGEDKETVRRAFDGALHVRDIRCSCHEYRLLASGSVDFLRSYSLAPWDHAAGLLLLGEAGGWAAVDGTRPYSPCRHDGRIVAAGSGALGRVVAALSARLP